MRGPVFGSLSFTISPTAASVNMTRAIDRAHEREMSALQVDPVQMCGPANYRGRGHGPQPGYHADPECQREDKVRVHKGGSFVS